MTDLVYVEGIGPAYAKKLQAAGYKTAEELLDEGCTPQGRKTIATKSGIDETLILRWINYVDLFRVKGVGSEYADLLEAAGVDTIPELAQRKAENLAKKIAEVNKAKELVRKVPTEAQVAEWIEQAKTLPRIITY